ncbi:hypothetical protein PPYR_02739 [Photinus pyralis]|uniref:Peptidase S1 domain-containing protein n=1 Tax=Photinus pyralis TaxID=7054 RepID=A0A5N4A0X1_PHOPY|nr:chymotrypsin-1-like isoform X2 [Photinus pyralis]KAB0790939.1 hypothetical protein PPYR_02739 [Photinus pyralis]
MKVLSIVQILIFALSLGSGTQITRIIGGTSTEISLFPYQASLRTFDNRHFCGGSVVSDLWVLTAAHCITRQRAGSFVVVLATSTLTDSGSIYGISKIIAHASYNPESHVNDIALLRMSKKITFGPTVKPIALSKIYPPAGAILTLSGWGLTRYPSNYVPNKLQTIQLVSISILRCKLSLPGYPVPSNHICTNQGRDKGACEGDSGGPLVYNGTQAGVVSWGIPCAKGYPDVFTAIAAYESWIKQFTAA